MCTVTEPQSTCVYDRIQDVTKIVKQDDNFLNGRNV